MFSEKKNRFKQSPTIHHGAATMKKKDVKCPSNALFFDTSRGELICIETGEVIADHLPFEFLVEEIPDNSEALEKVKYKLRKSGYFSKKRRKRHGPQKIKEVIETWKRMKRKEIKRLAEKCGISVGYAWEILNRAGLIKPRKKKRISKEIEKKAIELRKKGYTLPEIAKKLGISVKSAWRITLNVKPNKRRRKRKKVKARS